MSEPIQIPSKLKLQSSNQGSAAGSPLEVARVGIAPTSFTTRRTRTTSVTKKIDVYQEIVSLNSGNVIQNFIFDVFNFKKNVY